MTPTTEMSSPRSSLDRLLRPRSIAVVGASASPGSLGQTVVSNLERAHFTGDLYLINPKRAEIRGRACLPSIDALPENVDCAVFAIPRNAVLDALEACGRRKIGSVIIFSAGFAESGPQGRAEQEQLREIARRYQMLIEGPNCLGCVNYVDGIPLTFIVTQIADRARQAGVAIISQSGALAAVLGVNLQHHGLQISYSISTGNEATTGVEDFIEYLLQDEHTRVLTLIVEQFRQPRRLLDLAEKARALGKSIVLLHPGRSSAARDSAATHTGAMTSDYQVMCVKVEHAGVIAVETLEELVDVTQLLIRCPTVPCGGTAVLTESGAFKALTLDFCESLGIPLPSLSARAAADLRSILPDFISPSNPLDITAQGLVDTDLYRRALECILPDDQFGSIVLSIILTDEATSDLKFPPILAALRALEPVKPIVFAALDEGARFSPAYIEELRQLQIPFFPSPERAFRALARLKALTQPRDKNTIPSPLPIADLSLPAGVMPEYRSKQVIASLGIRVPEGGLANSLKEAQAIASRIGFPVALKIQATELTHKTDAGGVALDVKDPGDLASAWRRIHHGIHQFNPGLALDGTLVERMQPPGVELIVGAQNNEDWGAVLMVGSGGVLAEALQDTRLLPPDLSIEAIELEIHKLKCAPLLRGFRHLPPLDVRAVAEIIHTLGVAMRSTPSIQEIELNPLAVYPAGAVALDALIVVE